MKNNKTNIQQIIIVFFSFILMIGISWFASYLILRNMLSFGANEIMRNTELTILSNLREPETVTQNTAFSISELIRNGANQNDVLEYITLATEYLEKDDLVYGFNGLYGEINGIYIDGTGWIPPEGYVPKERPWYIVAIEANGNIAATQPYVDAQTGEVVISFSKMIFDQSDSFIGIIAIDVLLDRIAEFAKSVKLADGGYGILLNSEFEIFAHPDEKYLGLNYEELSPKDAEIIAILKNGENINALERIARDGKKEIVFFNKMQNGWYLGLFAPSNSYYQDVYSMVIILAVVGLVLSSLLCWILLRLSWAKMRADTESKYKTSFLANMSHEIRTPMNAITGMAELILRSDNLNEAQNYAKDIKHAGMNLVSIINDILDISKIEAGKLEIITVNYYLSSLINDTVDIINMKLKDRNTEKPIQFKTNIDETIPENLIGDEIRLRQILLNLLSNAVKFTEKGGISLTITTEKKNAAQIWLRITVTDTGIGMKEEDILKLFNDFVQVDIKKNRKIEGTGLGLAITKQLCEMMGGSITVESEVGKGSVFTVIIPQEIASFKPINTRNFDSIKQQENFSLPVNIFPDAKILIVDDLSVNLRIAEGLLKPYKAKIDTCLSGQEAIELVKLNDFDIVFMDHMMPEMDGIETVRRIREWEKEQQSLLPTPCHRLPIIALTANAVSGMKEMFIQNGFNDFLPKPIDVKKLDEMINNYINKKLAVCNTESESKTTDSKEKKTILIIPDVDTEIGSYRTGGYNNYLKVLEVLCDDGKKRLDFLESMHQELADDLLDSQALSQIKSQVHTIKSALATIGAEKTSQKAFDLEEAGKKEDIVFIKEKLPIFINELKELLKNINNALEQKNNE